MAKAKIKDLPFDDNCWGCEFCKKGENDKQPMCYNLTCNTKKCYESVERVQTIDNHFKRQ